MPFRLKIIVVGVIYKQKNLDCSGNLILKLIEIEITTDVFLVRKCLNFDQLSAIYK